MLEVEIASTVREMTFFLVGKSKKEKQVPVEAIFLLFYIPTGHLHRMPYGILYIRPCATDLIMAFVK